MAEWREVARKPRCDERAGDDNRRVHVLSAGIDEIVLDGGEAGALDSLGERAAVLSSRTATTRAARLVWSGCSAAARSERRAGIDARRCRDLQSIHGPWQMEATGLPASAISVTISSIFAERRM